MHSHYISFSSMLLTLCILHNFSCLYRLLTFLKINLKKSFRNTIRVSIDLDQDQCSVGPDSVQTVCKGYQQITKVAASKQLKVENYLFTEATGGYL